MGNTNQSESNDKPKTAYFRSKIAALTVEVAPPEAGQVQNQSVRFSPYIETFQGDDVKVGYLATDNPVAIKKCRADFNCEEIDQAEYEKHTDEGNPKVRRAKL